LIRRGDVDKIDPAQIAGIRHLIGRAARTQYGPSAREIVEITTKVPSGTAEPLYFLDGAEIPVGLARILDAKKITSVDVLKGQQLARMTRGQSMVLSSSGARRAPISCSLTGSCT
jgi:hypothetical protein